MKFQHKLRFLRMDIRHTIPPSRKFVPNFVLLYSCLHLSSYTKRNKKQTVPILFERFNLEYAWIRQSRSGSCHYPTAATKCNEQPSQATATPSVEKIYSIHKVSSLKFAYFQGRLSRHISMVNSFFNSYMGRQCQTCCFVEYLHVSAKKKRKEKMAIV